MKKIIILLAIICVLMSGCSKEEVVPETTAIGKETEVVETQGETAAESVLETITNSDDDTVLDAVHTYLVSYAQEMFPEAEHIIPAPVILRIDDSNPDCVTLWGNFWIYKYNLEETVLVCQSGGSMPGKIIVEKNDTGYKVSETQFMFTESEDELKAVCDNDEELMTMFSDMSDELLQAREDAIKEYAKEWGLTVDAYQDFGWDPVPLVE